MPSDFIQTLQNKRFSGREKAVVVGVDVGTTFSGVSYAFLYPGEVPRPRPVGRFSDQEVANNKIPSIIYYADDGEPKAVGQATTLPKVRQEAIRKRWFKSEHFKMHLRPSGQKLETNGLKLGELPPGKSAEQVMGDFLRYLAQETGKYISNAHGVETWNQVKDKVIYVLGHPNGWTGYCQQRYRRSAISGGLIPDTDEGHKRIKFVTEGEASALACLSGGLGPNTLRNGFRFMIADAGGGTVDLTTFEVVGTSPLQLKECAAPDCRFAGAVFVNMRAKALLQKRLAKSKYDDEEVINDLVSEEFEDSTKKQFTGKEDGLLVVGGRREEDEELGISGGFLTLRRDDLAECFKLSVSQTTDAVLGQFSASHSKEDTTPVWLVGGFGASEYLLRELRGSLERKGISIQTPDTNLSKAVANGAVLYYLDEAVVARVCPATYGTDCYTRFNPSRSEHLSRLDLVEREREGTFIGPIFDPIVEKDSSIDVGRTYSCSYWRIAARPSSARLNTELLRYDGDLPAPYWYNENKDKFKTVFRLEADLSAMLSRDSSVSSISLFDLLRGVRPYRRLDFDIELKFGTTEVEARIAWEDNGVTKYGPAKIIWLE